MIYYMITQKSRVGFFNSLLKKVNTLISRKNYSHLLKKTIIRIVISLVFLTILGVVQILNFQQPKKILSLLQTKLESEVKIESYFTQIKKLPNYIYIFGDKAKTAMKIEDKLEKKLILPIDGEITTYFNEKIHGTSATSKGLVFTSNPGENIYSIDEGVIIDIGSNKSIGNYIIIKHKGELLSAYKYLASTSVNINQRVEQGQLIGVSSEKLLLEVWYGNKPMDPMKYINISTQQL